MNIVVLQSIFYEVIKGDQRISARHISLYMALLHCYAKNSLQNPVMLKREIIMGRAKISSRVTYNKCMKELHEYGYIDYLPSYTAGASMANLKLLHY